MPAPVLVNIINFIRAVEPRVPVDLFEPVRQQLRLMREHRLPTTWLLQFDALLEPRFTDPLRAQVDVPQEIGLWFEVVQPLVERAGLPWRGRYPWDWHVDVGFSMGYTPAERERLADVCLEEFRAVFGEYPRSVGSWLLDAHLLGYLADRYGVRAACICKDQWGTDGYTLWGGYFNQAYYPSRVNAFMPAQRQQAQIPIPVFRMLGSDPIYQYDLGRPGEAQGVATLEPVYREGGGSPRWVRWFFDLTCDGPNLSFGYLQTGQENSFGWPAMAEGLTCQYAELAARAARRELRVETLEDSAAWFSARYPVTPASSVVAMADWKGEWRKAAWYSSRHYRCGLLWEDGTLRLRDLHCFDERYAERYLTERCPSPRAVYDTLPVMEGFLWSGDGCKAGMVPVRMDKRNAPAPLLGGLPQIAAHGDDTLVVDWNMLHWTFTPSEIIVTGDRAAHWALQMSWDPGARPPIEEVAPRVIRYRHEGFTYIVACRQGTIRRRDASTLLLEPEHGSLVLTLDQEGACYLVACPLPENS